MKQMSEKKLRCESWCKDCKAFDWSYCTEKYFKDENVVLRQPDVIKSVCGKCNGTDEYCTNCGTKIKAN